MMPECIMWEGKGRVADPSRQTEMMNSAGPLANPFARFRPPEIKKNASILIVQKIYARPSPYSDQIFFVFSLGV